MIVEAGHFALVLALCVAFVQGVLPIVGAARGNAAWMAVAPQAAIAQWLLVAVAFLALMHAYVTSDFSVLNVVLNSHTDKPLLYKISGVWGNHEGSMLLWVLILSLFGAAVALFGGNLPAAFRARVLSVHAWLAIGFYLFILLTSNPFERMLPPAENGQDLNPLLQDPGLAFHPPMLYLGYVGFSMAFSFAVAALIEGRVDASWARWVRPWTLLAWCCLTAGIALGSWWAYYELGWGGWWYWDPVENASFMPWLAGTALLHSATMVEKRDTLKGWTVFLAIVAFSLSLLGTFLVRSGVLTSVHAFATDPARGVFILLLLVFVIGGSLALFAWRGPTLRNTGLFQPISREGAMLLNNLAMMTGAAAVLLGTLYPLFLDAVGGAKVSVGPPFFNATFVPLMIPMIAAMAVGPLLAWKRGDLAAAMKRLWVAAAAAAMVALFIWQMQGDGAIFGALGIGLATWLLVGVLVEWGERIRLFRAPAGEAIGRLVRTPRASLGMTFAHAGLAIAIAGIAASTAWKVESIQTMKPGDTVDVAGYAYTFQGARRADGPNYTAVRGTFTVRKDDRPFATLEPEKRIYAVRSQPTTEAAIRTTFLGDLYAVIGDPEGTEGAFVTRIYFNPLVAWIWAGAMLMAAGGLLSLSDRRYRVGLAAGRRRDAPADASPTRA
ncbi:MAG: heme lyase CcmF/NrfE family subunit [Rhodospirillales bacterium]|nr:heme lyase CcmF/NrfE family subunit [Rhodospirillales bacterium]